MKNTHLITGITGQDGIFLSSKIIKSDRDARIIGISRDSNLTIFKNKFRYIHGTDYDFENIKIKNINLNDKKVVRSLIDEFQPNFIYNLSGPSSVYDSLTDGNKSHDQIIRIFDNLIDSIIKSKNICNFFQASSSEMFAPSELPLDENSKMGPRSPYAIAKFNIHNKIQSLKLQENLSISSGIMFNHESEFRANQYLIMKIINFVINIEKKHNDVLKIGSLDLTRDWSYAKDVADAIYEINSKNISQDYVIGSGEGTSISKVLSIIFSYFNLDWSRHVEIDSQLLRKGDPLSIVSNPAKINNQLDWESKHSIEDLLKRCIDYKKSVTQNEEQNFS